MIEDNGNGPVDPVEKDAKIIGDAAADLGQARGADLSDQEQDRVLAAEEQTIIAKRTAVAADEAVQHNREVRDEQVIADANADAQRGTGPGAVPGPTPPPQPPRPRVG